MAVICNHCGNYRAPADIEQDGICRQCKGKRSYALLKREKRIVKPPQPRSNKKHKGE